MLILRVIFNIFKAVSGLHINWGKSYIYPVNTVPNIEDLAEKLGGKVGELPTTYLGMPLEAKSNVTDRLDVVRRNFIWKESEDKKKYHLVKWEKLLESKKGWGLNIRKLDRHNKSLMMKWLWKFASPEEALGKEVIRSKYGMQDRWMTEEAQDATVAELWTGKGWNLHLRRNLNDCEVNFIANFQNTVPQNLNLTKEKDSLVWKVDSKGIFTVRPAYKDLTGTNTQEIG
ncbi:hypothetical protein H5410_020112 [Solanum commersonii]|uniref:Uncharacterized protein n=1 Tax=Solanum commersonii TaxID=4109 RepID=A0A9J5ZA94_SOLCO|nr:hypothetical protein H5410_020112 [Solanum commersonii]